MLTDWDAIMATLSPEQRIKYAEIRAKSVTYQIPRLENNAIIIEPEEFEAVLMAAAFKADEKYRMPKGEGPFPFEEYIEHVKSFNRRFKNPVKLWYPHAVLHVQDSINGRNGHFRLRPKGDGEETFFGG